MPLNPPALRFLRCPFPVTRFSSMSFSNSSIKHPSARPVPLLSRVFPSRLKYHSFGLGFPTSRSFSIRSEVRAGSKSLIEDENELDSWVSRLRTSSVRSGALTEDEEEAERGVVRKRGRGRESNLNSDDNVDEGLRRKGIRDSYDSAPSSRNFSRFGGETGVRGLGSSRGRGGMNMRGREGEFRGRDQMGRSSGPLASVTGSRRGGLDSNRPGRGGMNSRGREREFGSRDQPGRGLGPGFRGGGRMGGRGGNVVKERAPVLSSEEEEEDEDAGRGSRGVKRKADFVSLIAEDDSEEDSEEDSGDEEDEHEIKSRSSLFGNVVDKQSSASVSTGASDSYLSETRFDQCAVSQSSLKAIKDVGYEKMTMVQEATLPLILKGKDVLAKARTGTGKTVAFMLPSIEVVVNTPRVNQKLPPILVLVICPTRELASQAAAEGNKLLKYHPSIGVQVVIGGTRLSVEQKRIQANPCQILVATPGRLKDHIENTPGFATRLMGLKVLVLDEADHLLDMGFRREIERIIAAVPKQRQTLLFSATIPNEVRQITHIALKKDHEYVNTVVEGSGETHAQVRQTHLIYPLEKQFSLIYALLKEHISDDVNYKVLVFCTTAMVTRLVADLLNKLNLNVREIHSRKPQSYRTRISDEFRRSKGLILVTSDVSARGVDYPDVSLVIQMGLPSDREQYIHRLGRTGRKGKEGLGVLMLAPWEESFLHSLKDLPISKATPPMVDPDAKKKVERALSNVEMKNKEAAYQAWLGYYNSNKIVGKDKTRLVELANEFSRSMGLGTPPGISKKILGKMGLKNVPGLRAI